MTLGTPAGTLFVISAPSGAGKTSLVKALLAGDERLKVSISHTTRSRRESEIEGVDYHFVDEATFLSMMGREAFLESACVFDNHYGTSEEWVEETLQAGFDVILEIDWQGAKQVAEKIDCVTIFIIPPSIDALKERLYSRSEDDAEVIAHRMDKAKAEISHFDAADYLVVNDVFEEALTDLSAIVKAEKHKTIKQQVRHADLIKHLLD